MQTDASWLIPGCCSTEKMLDQFGGLLELWIAGAAAKGLFHTG